MKIKSIIKSKWFQVIASIVFTVVLLAIVFSGLDWNSFRGALRDLRLSTTIIVFGIFIASMLIQGFKYWLFLPAKTPWFAGLCGYIPGNFLTNTPMGIVTGPTVTMMVLRPWVDPIVSGSAIFLDMYTKVITLVLFMLLSALVATEAFSLWIILLLIGVSLLLMGLLLIASNERSSKRLAYWLNGLRKKKFGKNKVVTTVIDVLQQLLEAASVFRKKKRMILVHLVLGLIIEFSMALPYYVIARQLEMIVPWQNWLWVHCVVRIASMLPFTVGGLGAREATLMVMKDWIGGESGPIMTLALLYSITFIASSALMGIIFFLIRPKVNADTVKVIKL